ncbi:MAG: helix-turn-helix domain-containing protein [Thermoleophilia bacterium]
MKSGAHTSQSTPSTAPQAGAGTRELLSVSAAARMLGVSPSSLRAWAAAGRVPHVRTPGGHRRFRREELVQWLAEHGGEPPSQQPRTQELVPSRIDAMPNVAQALISERSALMSVFEEELARTRSAATTRASAARQARVTGTLDALSEGIRRGDLATCLREAEWEGFRYGAAGQQGEVPVTEALALRRAVDRVLEPVLADHPQGQRVLERSMDRLAVRVAAGYAEGVRVRLRAGSEQ